MGGRRNARLMGAVHVGRGTGGRAARDGDARARADDPVPVVVQQDFTTSDGVELRTTLTSQGPLSAPVDLAGPLSFEVPLSTTTPDSGIWVVLSDVAPDGTSHPLTVGWLSTSYPDVVEGKSLRDAGGTIVQPYGDYSTKKPAKSLQWRNYQVELWPVGNRFQDGHRIRLTMVGTSAASMPALPALHSHLRVRSACGRAEFAIVPDNKHLNSRNPGAFRQGLSA